ncbi:MAG: type II toxin-antitoxin system Phd/YefM family antitoxin [Candidatus Chisholmbacteria bacterium]|nr:type II toxin-antitoxin system Phd/YefM family antitoxin [Candidatus Chisholmbacteria bacterium]
MTQVVNATTLRSNLAEAINHVSKKGDYLLVTRGGQVASALVNIDLFEDLLALKSKKYVASIKRARREVKRGEVFSHTQVFGDLR